MRLNTISNIGMGLVLSRKLARDNLIKEKYYSLSLKSFQINGILNKDFLDSFHSKESLNKKYLTQKGDIIIRNSFPFTSVYINEDDEGLVVSSNFIIVRINKINDFLPEFISLYLNSDIVKKIFQQNSRGATVPVIKTSDVEEVELKQISIGEQKKLIEINNLQIKELFLYSKLLEEKELLRKEIIKKLISN